MEAALAQDRRCAVHRVALADAPKMHTRAGLADEGRACRAIDLNQAIVHKGEPGLDGASIGHRVVLVVIELPEVGERAERNVELAARPFTRLRRRLQCREGIAAHLNRLAAGRLVKATDIASGSPDAQQRVEPLELLKHLLERRHGERVLGGPGHQAQLRSHHHARPLHGVPHHRRR